MVDALLNKRRGAMLEAPQERQGQSLPTAFQDASNTKVAYHFFSNENASEDKILEGYIAASIMLIQATQGPIRILQDTSEFNFKRPDPDKVGFTTISPGRKLIPAICGFPAQVETSVLSTGPAHDGCRTQHRKGQNRKQEPS